MNPVTIHYLLTSIWFARIIGCICVHPRSMLGPPLFLTCKLVETNWICKLMQVCYWIVSNSSRKFDYLLFYWSMTHDLANFSYYILNCSLKEINQTAIKHVAWFIAVVERLTGLSWTTSVKRRLQRRCINLRGRNESEINRTICLVSLETC